MEICAQPDRSAASLSLLQLRSLGWVHTEARPTWPLDHFRRLTVKNDLRSSADGILARDTDWAESPTVVPFASLADLQSLNLYSYMQNNPLTGVDEDGHFRNGMLAPPVPEPWICIDCVLFAVDRNAWNHKHPILNKLFVALNPSANCPKCQLQMVPLGPGGDAALAASILEGFSADELVIANELIGEGNVVQKIPESTVAGQRTPDALVNGVPTEFKTVTASGETSVKNAIEKAATQNAQNILINARGSNLTAAEVQNQIDRAQGNVGGLTGRVTVWTKEGTVRF